MSGMSRKQFEFIMRKEKYKYEELYNKFVSFIDLQKLLIEDLQKENQILKRRLHVQNEKET